jgi:hypothetical protein
MFAWVFFSMSVMMNLFMIIIGDAFEVIQNHHKFKWLTDDREALTGNKEFDDDSSSNSSESEMGGGDNPRLSKPIPKKVKSRMVLREIVDQDYEEYIRNKANLN